ncbi:MAG: Wzz/FepE/Etk N-terminal domain-containing protein [Planctomycetia bacterium]|nr:Wzz/FepE/Etk N-terminal domain-containing protein [Planctomycetia bacterium]
MSEQPVATVLNPVEVLKVLAAHRKQWIVSTAVCAVLALLAAIALPRVWQASQAMVVRAEAAGVGEGNGKFRQLDDMKTAQETVLELAKSRTVLEAALQVVASDHASAATPQAVADLRDAVTLTPPKGAEFGKTEVFYLHVQDVSPERAVALNRAICEQLQNRLQSLRDAKAESTINELERGVALAERDLTESTNALSRLESEVGGDLAELRLLNGGASGDSDLRRKTVEIEAELRAAKTAQRESEKLLELLNSASDDHSKLLATPNRLLESQPALRRLKDGLVDAQLRTAQLRGTMSDAHPQVIAAQFAERNIVDQVHGELSTAVRGVNVDLELTSARVAALEDQVNANKQRLGALAGLRAGYSNLTADVTQRSELLQKSRRELADVRATRAGAKGPGVITLIDSPDTGNRPLGPGRATIVLGGVFGGLAIGFGLVFLTAPLPVATATGKTSTTPVTHRRRAASQSPVGGLRGALETLVGRQWSPSA